MYVDPWGSSKKYELRALTAKVKYGKRDRQRDGDRGREIGRETNR